MSPRVKQYLGTLLRALEEDAPFRSRSRVALFQPGLALNRWGQELGPTQPSLRSRTAIKIPFIRTPSPTGSGMPNHYIDDLLHTIGISGHTASCTRRRAPFRSRSRFARFQPGLALNRWGQQLSPTQPSLRSLTAIKIPFIRTPSRTRERDAQSLHR